MTNPCNCPNGSYGKKHTNECYEAEIERLRGQLDFANREPPHCPSCNCGATDPVTNPKSVDQTDIDIALETAQGIEDDGEPTAAECIRACARAAQAVLRGENEPNPAQADPAKEARRKLLFDLFDALDMHESIGTLRFTLLHGEFGDELRARAGKKSEEQQP